MVVTRFSFSIKKSTRFYRTSLHEVLALNLAVMKSMSYKIKVPCFTDISVTYVYQVRPSILMNE